MNKKNHIFLESNLSSEISNIFSEDLLKTIEFIYNPCGLTCTHLSKEITNKDYGAFIFKLNDLTIRFRSAKITPKKIGQFVTLWKRNSDGISQPYNIDDHADLFVISVQNNNNFGQFVFPKNILLEQNIIANMGKGGKRGIRVYPPWDIPENSTAQKTQLWQLRYFLNIPSHVPINCALVKKLYFPHLKL